MKKYRKKPVVIEAMQYDGTNLNDLIVAGVPALPTNDYFETRNIIIKTLEDGPDGGHQVEHIASRGDWIIKGVSGEFYPCKNDIFEKTYESVE